MFGENFLHKKDEILPILQKYQTPSGKIHKLFWTANQYLKMSLSNHQGNFSISLNEYVKIN
jgi:hypothetical protein